jgi:predicted nucleic acid-binding protein
LNYFDTSGLIKAFLVEVGTERVKQQLLKEEFAATATITYAEMYSGFSRKRREGGLSTSQYHVVCREFESYWPTCLQVELTTEVLSLARDLMKQHPLRAFDAIHLASAIQLKREMGESVTMIAADERLLQAAMTEGLVAMNIETGRES